MEQIVPSENNGRFVVYASTYAKLDSDVINGGGTDDTGTIQAILNKAQDWGGLHLVMDGAALVRGLNVYSNTTIECENKDCGFFLESGANRSIIENAHLDYKVRHDKNITLLGGTYNHNCTGQEHHLVTESISNVFGKEKFVIAMEFYGVEHLTLRDVTIRNQRTFAMLVANWYRVTMENITIELPDNMYAQNQDGIHFWGPGQYLSMRNIMGSAGDDFIALAPDENDCVSDITDVVIDGVHLNDADQGIRMLSRDKGRLDRVIVRNVTGTFKSFGFYINPWFPGADGNYGTLTFENIDLRQTKHKYEYANPFLFRIGGNIEALTLKDIFHHNPSEPLPLFEIGIPYVAQFNEHTPEHSHIGTFVLDGLHIDEKESRATSVSAIKVFCPIDTMIIRNTNIRQTDPTPDSCLLETTETADIGVLHISGLTATRMNTLINHSGRIGVVCLNDIVCTDVAKPLIIGDGETSSLHANAVYGAEVR